MSRIQLSLTASLIAINTLAFAETPFKVSTASHEGATVTSIWAGESGFVGQPQWDARGKSFFILESTGSIHH